MENKPDTENTAASSPVAAAANPPPPSINSEAASQVPDYKIPGNVQSDGAFRYRVAFDIPKYRGLEPNLGIAYNSSFKGRGRSEVYLGAGWQLQGFSSIERISVGGGTPSYDDGDFNTDDGSRDIFRLDGSDLMACADNGATNPWNGSWNYPDRFKTDVVSASCLTGGNMSTLVESYRRIEMKYQTIGSEQIEYFVVTSGDGTTYKYESLGVLAGDTPNSASADFDILFRRKFLLTEIVDVQTTPNKVEYFYYFADIGMARAHRPSLIKYGNYRVHFYYEYFLTPLATYAVGSDTRFGSSNRRLRSITVTDGGIGLRAYGMEYSPSPIVGTHLLNKVRAYGSDYQRTGSIIDGGAELPELVSGLQYNSDTVVLSRQEFSGAGHPDNKIAFDRGLKVMDIDRDGRDDLIFLPNTVSQLNGAGCTFGSVGLPWASAYQQNISVDANGNRTLGVDTTRDGFWLEFVNLPNLPASGTVANFVGLLPYTTGLGNSYIVRNESRWARDIEGGFTPLPGGGLAWQGMLPFGSHGVTTTTGDVKIGNFDDDAEYELLIKSGPGVMAYDFDGTGIMPIWTTSNPIMNGGSLGSAMNIDVNGDGIKEQLFLGDGFTPIGYSTPLPTGTSSPWVLAKHGEDGIQKQTYLPAANALNKWGIAVADLNGDGNDDLVYVNKNEIRVALSSGNGFLGPVEWLNAANSAAFRDVFASGAWGRGAISTGDVNGDGLDDIVIHGGYSTTGCHEGGNALFTYGSRPAYIFLSNGTEFVSENTFAQQPILSFIGMGDFDGNGLPDMAAEGQDGYGKPYLSGKPSIWFNDGGVSNLLTDFDINTGGDLSVEYAPSTMIGTHTGNAPFAVPRVTQLVKTIEVGNGRGDTRSTSFSYTNNKYDYVYRRALGHETVTASLPAIDGETEGPIVVTTYLNDHIGQRGRIVSQTNSQDGTVYKTSTSTWTSITQTNGPFRTKRSSATSGLLYGADMFETLAEFTWTYFGALSTVKSYGFVDGNGADLDPNDNTIRKSYYTHNYDKYLVKHPRRQQKNTGLAISTDRQTWLLYELLYYDGAAYNSIPVSGNLTKIRSWDGDLTSPGIERIDYGIFTYDAYGNLLTSKDPENNIWTYTYDTAKHLFRLTEENPDARTTTTVWNTGCQSPASVTDANALTTSYTYDVHCRETRADFPSGQYQATVYVNIGNGYNQYVKKYSQSPSQASNSGTTHQRSYFDGFGDTYMETASGADSTLATSSVTVRGFDGRGNVSWQSTPLSWADAYNTTIPQTSQVQFRYDPVNRLIETTQPDGAKSTVTFLFSDVAEGGGPSYRHPRTKTKDENCFDTDDESVCGIVNSVTDARANMIQMILFDYDHTDVNSVSILRRTIYTYDLRNRLTAVTDPGGATWAYSYDYFGNRLMSDDPDLGVWTMAYDRNNNLVQQTNAKGQMIAFDYDNLDRVTEKRVIWNNGSPVTDTTQYTYDQNHSGLAGNDNIGHLTTQSTPDHEIRYGHDNQGNVVAEQHILTGSPATTYLMTRTFHTSGALLNQTLPTGNGNPNATTATFTYDAAARITGLGSYITGASYNLRGQPTLMTYGNGISEEREYDTARGWIDRIRVRNGASSVLNRRYYYRNAAGQVIDLGTQRALGRSNYCYDYAGRLLVAADLDAAGLTCSIIGSWTGAKPQDQFFSYGMDSSMRSNSFVGTYDYSGSPVAHAPKRITGGDVFTYDANGNMTTGLHGKLMTYDGENRPLSVTSSNGDLTEYVYAADGTRLKRTVAVGANTTTSLYLGNVEIVNSGSTDTTHWYLHPNVRVTHKSTGSPTVNYLHRDQLGSVVLVANASGDEQLERIYAPFGVQTEYTLNNSTEEENFGFIGERLDAVAGLQYLNARYYDPEFGMFIQPDWLDVRLPGVGTNRYAYSANDPINLIDPSGNVTIFVDGTNSDGGWREDDPHDPNDMFSQVEDIFGETPIAIGNTYMDNNRKARTAAVEQLASLIANHPNEPIRIIAHSHGGNVVKEYTNRLDAVQIEAFVALGVPQRADYQLNKSKVDRYVNVYSNNGAVQLKAGADSKFSGNTGVMVGGFYGIFSPLPSRKDSSADVNKNASFVKTVRPPNVHRYRAGQNSVGHYTSPSIHGPRVWADHVSPQLK